MHFETAGIDVAPWLPPLVAFGISFFTSMGGVSGAFLLLPFQMSFLGFTHPSVSSTNQLFNVVAIPSGVYRYVREGRMVWPLTWSVVIGTLPGVFIGAVLRVAYLPDPKNFKLFAALVLFYMGARLARDLLGRGTPGAERGSSEKRFQELAKQYQRKPKDPSSSGPLPTVGVTEFTFKCVGYEFYGEHFEVPFWKILALSFSVGIVGGIYGIGGGAILAPLFVSFFHLPVYTVAGATLMGTFVTSVAGVAFYQVIAPLYPDMAVAPDWLLGTLFGLGGMVGMYAGARCQKFVRANWIKGMLAGILVYAALKYVLEFLSSVRTGG